MSKEQSYEAFVEKFHRKQTSDDCYTPPPVFDVVLQWVRETYSIPTDAPIVRPFYPDKEYQEETYPEGCIVVDNPPFSILSRIVDFFLSRDIKFFLFAPALTILSYLKRDNVTIVGPLDYLIVFENGAKIKIAFLTNLSPDIAIRTAPELSDRVRAVNQPSLVPTKKQRKLYAFQPRIFATKHFVEVARIPGFTIRRGDYRYSRNKLLFGGGCVLSQEASARLKAARLKAALPIPYSDGELRAIAELDAEKL